MKRVIIFFLLCCMFTGISACSVQVFNEKPKGVDRGVYKDCISLLNDVEEVIYKIPEDGAEILSDSLDKFVTKYIEDDLYRLRNNFTESEILLLTTIIDLCRQTQDYVSYYYSKYEKLPKDSDNFEIVKNDPYFNKSCKIRIENMVNLLNLNHNKYHKKYQFEQKDENDNNNESDYKDKPDNKDD